MAAFERAVECLRPLVNNKTAWDFCVVWKLGDDPSRFIEWRGCCCSGGNSQDINVKEENRKEQILLPICRDAGIQHPVRTEACKALAKLPSSIPLYHGIHGEVVISKQPRWLTNANSSISNGPFGTQVLVPVPGGLIELFSGKHAPKDQQIIDFIMAQYISVEQQARTANSFMKFNMGEAPYCPFFDDCLNELPATIHNPNFTSLQFPPKLSKCGSFPSIQGSSTGSSLPNDLGSSHPSSNTSPEKSSGRYPLKRSRTLDSRTKREANFYFAGATADKPAENEDGLKTKQRAERESYQSKNLITERNRRNRIKHGLFSLRALVPNISKMDILSILVDAIEYIQELQKSVKRYQDELRDMAEEDCSKSNAEQDVPNLCWKHEGSGNRPSTELNDNPSRSMADDRRKAMVEVSQIGARNFLVRIICKQRRGGFLRLVQAVDSSGLQVIDANVTTSNGSVLSVLRVEANRKEIQPNALKDSLFKLLC